MIRKILLAGAVAVTLVAGAANASANLVTNGSFETGDFSSWTQSGDTSFTAVLPGCFDLGCPTDGSYQAVFGTAFADAGITQTIATSGMTTVSFDLSDDQGSYFAVALGNHILDTQGSVGSYGVTHESFTVYSTGLQDLTFNFRDDLAWYTLDNVVVTSGVPETATWALMLIGFGALGAGMRSRRAVRPAQVRSRTG